MVRGPAACCGAAAHGRGGASRDGAVAATIMAGADGTDAACELGPAAWGRYGRGQPVRSVALHPALYRFHGPGVARAGHAGRFRWLTLRWALANRGCCPRCVGPTISAVWSSARANVGLHEVSAAVEIADGSRWPWAGEAGKAGRVSQPPASRRLSLRRSAVQGAVCITRDRHRFCLIGLCAVPRVWLPIYVPYASRWSAITVRAIAHSRVPRPTRRGTGSSLLWLGIESLSLPLRGGFLAAVRRGLSLCNCIFGVKGNEERVLGLALRVVVRWWFCLRSCGVQGSAVLRAGGAVRAVRLRLL